MTRGAADTPVELPVPRQQEPGGGSGIPLVPMSQRRIEPIHGLVSQYQPPEFRGTTDPTVADDWIRSVEGTMEIFPMTDQEKIRYASFLFKGDARVWWDLVRETEDISTMTWADFKRVFDAEYRTADMIAVKTQEFVSLQQGTGSVKEYSTRFNSLARFAPGLVSTPRLRLDRFFQGLDPVIALHVTAGPSPPQTYAEALDRALRAEVYVRRISSSSILASGSSSRISIASALVADTRDSRASSEVSGARGKRKFQQRGNRRGEKGKRQRPSDTGTASSIPRCSRCGKAHSGQCLQGRNVCYRCGQPGHIQRFCQAPALTSRSAPTSSPATQITGGGTARVYTVAQSQAEASPTAVTGQILFHDLSV